MRRDERLARATHASDNGDREAITIGGEWGDRFALLTMTVDTPGAVVHSCVMTRVLCLTVADRRRRRFTTGVQGPRMR